MLNIKCIHMDAVKYKNWFSCNGKDMLSFQIQWCKSEFVFLRIKPFSSEAIQTEILFIA